MADTDYTDEIWKRIPGYEGFYEASSAGRIRAVSRDIPCQGKIHHRKSVVLKPGMRGKYWCVSLCMNGLVKLHSVHRLVALAFYGPAPEAGVVRHKNGRPTDNRSDNLEYGTVLENFEDRRRHGTWPSGAGNARAKLSEAQALAIIADTRQHKEIAAAYNVGFSRIGKIKRGESWAYLHSKSG